MLRDKATDEPAWEIATLFPPQHQWSIEEYLALDARVNRLIEFSHGTVEVLPMPSIRHQRIVAALFRLLSGYVQKWRVGEVLFAPVKIALWAGKVREPDIVFVAEQHRQLHTEQWFEQVDLVMEVISPDDPARDLETKRREYAQARIPEYWVIDPRTNEILVLTLGAKWYEVHGVFGSGDIATSPLLAGFAVVVDDVLAAG